MDQNSLKIPEFKRAELNAILKQQEESLKVIEEKQSFEKFMVGKMEKRLEEKEKEKESDAKVEEKKEKTKKETAEKAEEPKLKKKDSEPPKITELIMKEATQLQEQFFENEIFLKEMNEKNDTEMTLMAKFTNLADAIMDAACSGVFDCEITQNLMNQFTDFMTNKQGITSFEFQQSGLLKALEIFLTKSASQAHLEV